jgi:hypothetical protein
MVQLGQLAGGGDIHHNVFAFGALDWKNPFGPYQDNGAQFGVRWGSVAIHHNIFIGGASTFFQLFPQPRDGDPHVAGDEVRFHDNYFSDSRNMGAYLHNYSDGVTAYRFDGNVFRDIVFEYDELGPAATDPNTVFRTFNTSVPFVFADNRWSGPQSLLDPVGGNAALSGNVHEASIPSVVFVDWGLPPALDPSRLETWTAATSDGAPVFYSQGDFVMHVGALYRCIASGSHTGAEPTANPAIWQLQPAPADDVRLAISSPHQQVGLLDRPHLFADSFETGDVTGWSASQP